MRFLPYARFQAVDLHEVQPAGWIREYLMRQCSGLTGHVEASGYLFGEKFWGCETGNTEGAYTAWWPYEQTAYWLDGARKWGMGIIYS